MKNMVYLLIFLQFIFSSELYREIRVNKNELENVYILQSLGLDLDHIYQTNNYIQFVATDYHLQKLILNNINFEIIHEDLERFYQSRLIDNYSDNRDFDYGSMGGYYTFSEIEEQLDEISNTYPNIVTSKISIGETLEGRNIWAIKISDNPNDNEDEPKALYTGLHHAREPMSYMNLFYFMYWLVENYEIDSLATHIINNRQLWFIPAVNPDDLVYNQSMHPNGGGMQRKNMRETCNNTADGIDLNRNYSYMWAYDNEGSSDEGCDETYRGTGPFSEPETQAVRDFIDDHEFPIALNYHSYGNLLIYPYGYEYENQAPQEDIDILIEYGQDMVQFNNYELGTGPDLLYTVNGEACDWMYGVHDIYAYTPEIGQNSDGFWPATNRIFSLAEENLYPNQIVALNVGSKYEVNLNVNSNNFIIGENYPLSITISNKGRGDSNGNVYVNIESSNNLIFELEQIVLDEVDSREVINLGNITYFQLSQTAPVGVAEDIRVLVYDEDQYLYENSIQITLGETITLINEHFENDSDWFVGDLSDDATAGIWERAIPEPTYENNEIVQTDEDHTPDGSYCYMTANSWQPNSPGTGDVDGGKTTLFSPIYNLSDYSGAIVKYWNWYTNDQGNNPGTDFWRVDVSADGGETWILLENSNSSNNEWEFKQFLLSDYLGALTENIQFRFIAEDIYYEGDQGSGGSLVEAALDDFSIDVFQISDEECSVGDLNSDGSVNVLDIVIVVNIVVGSITVDDILLCLSDFNEDGLINVLDIVLLVNIILS